MTFMGKEIDALFIIAQIIGFLASGFAIGAYQSKHRKNIIAMQTFSNSFWIIHYFMLGSISAVVANAIGAVRNVIYGFRGKYKFADSKITPTIFILVFLAMGIVTYDSIIDIIPTLAMIIASIAFFIKDERIIRLMSLSLSILWFVFSIFSASVAGAVSEGLTMGSILIAIFRYRTIYLYERRGEDPD